MRTHITIDASVIRDTFGIETVPRSQEGSGLPLPRSTAKLVSGRPDTICPVELVFHDGVLVRVIAVTRVAFARIEHDAVQDVPSLTLPDARILLRGTPYLEACCQYTREYGWRRLAEKGDDHQWEACEGGHPDAQWGIVVNVWHNHRASDYPQAIKCPYCAGGYLAGGSRVIMIGDYNDWDLP